MKRIPMIVAIMVSVISAQGALAQEDLAYVGEMDSMNSDYESETQEYTEIEIVDLPISVQDKTAEDYSEYRIYKAFISKDNTYKIILKNEINDTKVVFASANGEWISSNDKS